MRRLSIHLAICAASIVPFTVPAKAGALPDPPPCSSCFPFDLQLEANPADSSGKTRRVSDDFYFIDDRKVVWKSGKGDITDGASIPPIARSVVGKPFEEDFLWAAVIHDHYCKKEHRVRPWRDTARVFYKAMVVHKVNIVKAKTMYFAVYTFGPHWDYLQKGVPCGPQCLYNLTPPMLASKANGDTYVLKGLQPTSPLLDYVEEPADYKLNHDSELQQIQAQIEANEIAGTPLSLDDLDRLAVDRHRDNVFLTTMFIR